MVQDILLTVDEGKPADAARFFAAGEHLIALLDALSDSPKVEWKVADLRLGCAVAGLELPVPTRTKANVPPSLR